MLLDLESSGGLNVWGHDTVTCGPVGGAVTQESYRAYLAGREVCGAQGCGPLQLTWPPLQDRADVLGGCWRPEINVQVGLTEFRTHLRRHTAGNSYSLYNTGRVGPSPYATQALALLPHWHHLVGTEPQGEPS